MKNNNEAQRDHKPHRHRQHSDPSNDPPDFFSGKNTKVNRSMDTEEKDSINIRVNTFSPGHSPAMNPCQCLRERTDSAIMLMD